METSHGIALLFAVIFIIIASVFNKFLWWLLSFCYIMALSYVAVTGSWEVLFWPPVIIFGIISLPLMFITAITGEWY